jgi:hypothetical protein
MTPMACTPEVITLPVTCKECSGAVELQCERVTNRDTQLPASYECPHCRKMSRLTLPGRVVSVSPRA